VPERGFAVHEALRGGVVRALAAFDEVACHREWRTGKPDERRFPGELSLDHPDGGEHVGEALVRIDEAQFFDRRSVPDRLVEARPFTRSELEGRAHGLEGEQDVREQDRRIHAESMNGLQRHHSVAISGCLQISRSVCLARMARYSGM